jgi:hypothetical protein
MGLVNQPKKKDEADCFHRHPKRQLQIAAPHFTCVISHNAKRAKSSLLMNIHIAYFILPKTIVRGAD